MSPIAATRSLGVGRKVRQAAQALTAKSEARLTPVASKIAIHKLCRVRCLRRLRKAVIAGQPRHVVQCQAEYMLQKNRTPEDAETRVPAAAPAAALAG